MLLEPGPDLACEAGQNGHLAVWLPHDRLRMRSRPNSAMPAKTVISIFPTCVVVLPKAPRSTGICRRSHGCLRVQKIARRPGEPSPDAG